MENAVTYRHAVGRVNNIFDEEKKRLGWPLIPFYINWNRKMTLSSIFFSWSSAQHKLESIFQENDVLSGIECNLFDFDLYCLCICWHFFEAYIMISNFFSAENLMLQLCLSCYNYCCSIVKAQFLTHFWTSLFEW